MTTPMQYLAAHDGEVIKLKACCRLEVELSPTGRIEVRHDERCAAIRPASPNFARRRVQANQAIARELTRRGYKTMAVMLP